jgi:hypothetical protein
VLRKYSGTGKKMVLKKFRKLRPNAKGSSPVGEAFSQHKSSF